MTDKSPRQQLSQKSGQSLKEKRAAKQAKGAKDGEGITPPPRKLRRTT